MQLRRRRPAIAQATTVIDWEPRVAPADGLARTMGRCDDLPTRPQAAQIIRLRPPATPTSGKPGSAWRCGGPIAGAAQHGAGYLAADDPRN